MNQDLISLVTFGGNLQVIRDALTTPKEDSNGN